MNKLLRGDYYPFGMGMVGRAAITDESYRYGFNGKEKDDEVKGNGNQYDYGMRIYDPRLGRFLSVDPLSDKYPWYTPYQFSGNKPIWCIDLDGLEDIPINGGNYYSVEMLKQLAFRDVRVQSAINRGERVVLKQSYSVISNGQRNPIARQIVLNEGSVGANIAGYNQDGNFYENGSLGPSGLTQTFDPSVGIFQPTPPAPEPPELPQLPPNPPVTDQVTQSEPKPKKPSPPTARPHNPPKAKPPISNPRQPQQPAPVAPLPPEVPPPTPNASNFCLTCFNGESRIHWQQGVNEMTDWLKKNPNYNLVINADGNSTILGRGWDQGTRLLGGGPTYRQRANNQFQTIQNLLRAAGIDPNRIKLALKTSTGGSLNYQAEKRNP